MRILFLILFTTLLSCKNNNIEDEFGNILEQKFIEFVDTVAYKHYNFFITPNLSGNGYFENKKKNELGIDIITEIGFDSSLMQRLSGISEGNKAKDFLKLVEENRNNKTSITFDFSTVKNTGLYNVYNKTNLESFEEGYPEFDARVGFIIFNKPLINDSNAIIILEKISSPKSAIKEAFFLKKDNNGSWKIEFKEELQRS